MLKKILYWTDEKFEEVVDNPNEKHPYIKSFGLGAVEGVLDGLVIGGIINLVVGGIVLAVKHKK